MTTHDDISKQPPLRRGRYRHYKGNDYEVLNLACHSESHEWLVVYKRLYDAPGPELWVRPYDMFIETVIVDGAPMPRFAYINDEDIDKTPK